MQSKAVVLIVVLLLGGGSLPGCGSDAEPAAPVKGEVYKIVNPLAEVEVGEWAIYRLDSGQTMRLEVLSVDPATRVVTVREEIREARTNVRIKDSSRPIPPNHFLWGYDRVRALVARIYEDPITVAGRNFDAFCVEMSGSSMGPVRHWYSPQVPVVGLIRQQRVDGGTIKCELVDWSGKTK